MSSEQTIERPFGISVFGSYALYVEPDIASLRFRVSHLTQHPREAFAATKEASQHVLQFLAASKVKQVNSSRVTLLQNFDIRGGIERKFVGYTATVEFRALLRNLEQLEATLTGIVDAGANEIDAVELQTSRLKEYRAEARRFAVEAARDKADNYCLAAGVKRGPVIHIEDIDPTTLNFKFGHRAPQQTYSYGESNDGQISGAFAADSIVINAAVAVAYQIEP